MGKKREHSIRQGNPKAFIAGADGSRRTENPREEETMDMTHADQGPEASVCMNDFLS
jgi:hypothetical protein